MAAAQSCRLLWSAPGAPRASEAALSVSTTEVASVQYQPETQSVAKSWQCFRENMQCRIRTAMRLGVHLIVDAGPAALARRSSDLRRKRRRKMRRPLPAPNHDRHRDSSNGRDCGRQSLRCPSTPHHVCQISLQAEAGELEEPAEAERVLCHVWVAIILLVPIIIVTILITITTSILIVTIILIIIVFILVATVLGKAIASKSHGVCSQQLISLLRSGQPSAAGDRS